MKWTKKHPKKSGFYWYREEHRTVILELREGFAKGALLTWDWQQGRLAQYPIATYPGEWYGPLKKPR